ncbi:MAG TPA: 3-deoxy-manno-octulosonate cytidylyltransferase [Bacteroidota bacterium]|nr:3-deoxy-manno-octulosonate cytidylyltransferase [Bacteroidota bacterium]
MHIVGVIPARYASTRLPAKPLVDLLGKPMVQRVYEQAKQSRLLHEVLVATDDERIAAAVEAFGGNVMMTSPEIPTGSDRLAAIAEAMRGDIFVNIQGDEPLINPLMIDQAIQVVLDDPHAQVGTLAKKIESADELLNPNVVKVVFDSSMFALLFSRSVIPHVREQSDPRQWVEHHTFYKHVGLYVFRREALLTFAYLPESPLEKAEKLEQLRALEAGIKIKVALTEFESVPVDTEEDARRVRAILAKTEHTAIER